MFLRSATFLDNFLINVLLIILWHLICFFACITISPSVYSYKKRQFKAMKWEKCGKWYEKKVHIKRWKDLIPQYVGKDGFSKQHFKSMTPEYMDNFISETCRAEWSHSRCLLYVAITFIVSSLPIAIVFSLLTLAINIPIIMIQRYNRFRILKLKSKLSELKGVNYA